MFKRVLVVLIASIIFIDKDFSEARPRQKRCIVIQKQSGTHGDSNEDDNGGEEYRKPQPKEPRPDRLRRPYGDWNKDHDAEAVSPTLSKYKVLPMRSLNDNRLRNRLIRKYLS